MTERIVVYGDFNCPWSYLAARRAGLLERAGTSVDWRAVEHDPWRPRRFSDSSERFAALREELPRVERLLLPGERLPTALAGFTPYTKSAVTGYAEAYGAGVAARARRLLFDAFWAHGLDIGDAKVVRTLLVDTVRSGTSHSDPLHEWGYAVDVTGGPVTGTGWRLVRDWRAAWRATWKEVVPMLVVDGGEPVVGEDAVAWLGAELVRRDVDVTGPAASGPAGDPPGDPEQLGWVSRHGSRWLRSYQHQHIPPLFPSAS